MTTTADRTTTRHQMIFVNLPVADVAASREFFAALGYSFNEELCNEGVLALELGPDHFAMLLKRDFFDEFHDAAGAEPGQHEVLTCLSAESREATDRLVDAAIAAGGTQVRQQEYGDWMYARSYADLDSHIWEIMWMDVDKAREAAAFG